MKCIRSARSVKNQSLKNAKHENHKCMTLTPSHPPMKCVKGDKCERHETWKIHHQCNKWQIRQPFRCVKSNRLQNA